MFEQLLSKVLDLQVNSKTGLRICGIFQLNVEKQLSRIPKSNSYHNMITRVVIQFLRQSNVTHPYETLCFSFELKINVTNNFLKKKSCICDLLVKILKPYPKQQLHAILKSGAKFGIQFTKFTSFARYTNTRLDY